MAVSVVIQAIMMFGAVNCSVSGIGSVLAAAVGALVASLGLHFARQAS